jgi:ribonuclease J
MSESIVGATFSQFFKTASKKRIVVATFSSNIHRVQQIVDEAVKCKRKVCVSGRSMENVVNIAMELGYLNIPQGVLIPLDMIRQYKDEQLVIITTGSQGEPMSALHRMAYSDHKKISVGPNDLIIISATPIPGNEKMVNSVVNELMKLGAQVVYERMYDVHVSGHACQEELKLMLNMVNPQYFVPVHGEQMHLRKNAQLASDLGIHKDRIIISDIGKISEITDKRIRVNGEVPSGFVLVDGLGVGDVGSVVLRDRKHLSEDGILVVGLAVDRYSGQVVSGPELISRGFVFVKESDTLLEDARRVVERTVDFIDFSDGKDLNAAKNKIRDALSRYIYQITRKSPMILPVIMEV